MLRKGIAAALLAGWLATPVQAGLLEAMTTALTGLQASETTSNFNAYRQELSYDDLLFIDPFASTKNKAVYRNGPELEYDPLTGGLTIVAPPMLGPADEFGIRREISPSEITIHAGEFFADSPTFPNVRRYERNAKGIAYLPPIRGANGLLIGLQPIEEDNASFHLVGKERFSLNVTDAAINLSIEYRRTLSGSEVRFPSLLAKGLDTEFYSVDSRFSPDANLWPTRTDYNHPDQLPEVHVVVHYRSTSPLGYRGHTVLAVPKVVPEPATSLFVLMASTMLLFRRVRRR